MLERTPLIRLLRSSHIRKNGFTLIELLVVVLIIGILAAIALPQYNKAVEKSRIAQAITYTTAIGRAEQMYYLANNSYTNDFDALDLDFSGTNENYLGNAKRLKDFTCRPWTNNSSAWADTLAVCSRNPQQTKYAIAFYKDGRLLCRFYNTEGENICKSVATGGKQTIGGTASYVL